MYKRGKWDVASKENDEEKEEEGKQEKMRFYKKIHDIYIYIYTKK